ncbi:serine/threonine-protein kinase ULK4-like [Nerophis ophidion]|uniref:serine/threonine-protein kinase ULK4-like n=1 Tax=Nerophis ophidion TaxID=159077 RepID=UPI002ADF9417|nr:serine/threonine-protein kinase ULK4-like [Nerophis ophidion]
MDNFILYEELGSGSTSVVYKGRRKGHLNYVALKCSDKAKRPEITNHVRLSQLVDHPNIVHFYEWYETKKHLWLVTEICTGGSLESVIKRDGCLPEDVVRKFGWDLVKGLNHIYKLGIIFSDLTPTKILVDSSGMLKLGNFCHSKTEKETLKDFFSLCCEDAKDEKYDEMMKKRIEGSTTYKAPEVQQGAETTVKSDLWALGCILYYMYTGRPFSFDNDSEHSEINLDQQPSSSVQTVSPTTSPTQDFQNLLRGLLTRNPDERMNLSDVLNHNFWTQGLNEEEDLEELEEMGAEEGHCAKTIKGRQMDSVVSNSWECVL